MSIYQRALASIVFVSGLIVIIQGLLIAYSVVTPPTSLAIVSTVLIAFAVVGLGAAGLLLFSFFK